MFASPVPSAFRAYDGKDSTALLRWGISTWPYVGCGSNSAVGDVGSMSGLPESGHGWAIYEYTP
jgi:hypothetical protein